MKEKNRKKIQQEDNPYIVVTWAEVAKFFPYSRSTVVQKYGKEMLATGAVFLSKIGMSRIPVVWGFPQQIRKYIRLKAEEQKGWI